jgi:hypothetical protein
MDVVDVSVSVVIESLIEQVVGIEPVQDTMSVVLVIGGVSPRGYVATC